MHILVVEDEVRLAETLKEILKTQKYTCDLVYDGEDGLAYAESGIYDVILLDIMLPKMNGFDVVRTLRSKKVSTPVILLTARDEVTDKVKGLDCGADDYLTKPFLMQELLLRVQRILQRAYRAELCRAAPPALELGDCQVDLADAAVYRPDGVTLPLTATERALLQKLADNRGHIVTYDALCEAVWGADYYGCENALNVHIRHLREKLEENASRPQWLLTVRGIGYKLAGEAQR